MATADPDVRSWTPINPFAMLRTLINAGASILTNAGAPTNGTSGTYAGAAGKGSLLMDITNGILYTNSGSLASPFWTQTSVAYSGSGPAIPGQIQVATGQITPANIIGTGAGQLGHANGVVLVPPAPANAINELVSLVVAMDFGVAAYTAGGSITVNISGGGAALTGVVTQTVLIQAAADVVVELVPLAATRNIYTTANGLALVSTVAPTNPGTAAGVLNWVCAYRPIAGIVT